MPEQTTEEELRLYCDLAVAEFRAIVRRAMNDLHKRTGLHVTAVTVLNYTQQLEINDIEIFLKAPTEREQHDKQ